MARDRNWELLMRAQEFFKRWVATCLLVVIALGTWHTCYGIFYSFLQGKSASVKVRSGGNFVVDKPIPYFPGSLKRDAGGTISGASVIVFYDGAFQEATVSGIYIPATDTTSLSGNGSFRAEANTMSQILTVSGQNNRIDGVANFRSSVVLWDSNTTATFALESVMNQNIVLNGGTIKLDNDLEFADTFLFTGSGIIDGSGYCTIFGSRDLNFTGTITWRSAADIELNSKATLSSVWTFTGINVITGNGNIFDLGSVGTIIVSSNSSLLLKNAIIKNVSDSNIRCADATGVLILQDVVWQQSANTTFTSGALRFSNDVIMQGGGTTFAYQSSQTSTILSNSILYLDEGLTFSYAPATASRSLFQFTDTTAQLQLHGATLQTTTTGMDLKHGKMSVLMNSFISSGTGITFGNNSSADDFIVEILSGTRLKCTQGILDYKNVLTNSWSAMQNDSNIYMSSGSTLRLYQNLDVGNGTLTLEGGTTLAIASGKQFIGSIFALGAYTYTVF
jgi:hypothetical protein